MKQKKFGYYGITVFPKDGNKVDWGVLLKKDISLELDKLLFWTPLQMGNFLHNFSIQGEKRKNGKGYYFSKLEEFGGQLEVGSKNNRPHYQLFIKVKPKLRYSKVLRYFSKVLYDEDSSAALSITVLTEDTSSYEEYCWKDMRANLPGKYEHALIDSSMSTYVNYVEKNPRFRRVLENPYSYQKWLLEFVKRTDCTRKLLWIVDVNGNSGKSIFSDCLDLDPRLNSLLVYLDYFRACRHGMAIDLTNFMDRTNGVSSSALIIDAPWDKERKHLHDIYALLEELNNGRVVSLFGSSRFKYRIEPGIPIIVFSNAPPRVGSLSKDRWDIKAIYRNVMMFTFKTLRFHPK